MLVHATGCAISVCRQRNDRRAFSGGFRLIQAAKPANAKLFVCLEQYAQAWKLLGERERIWSRTRQFAGMRESEVFVLWYGAVNP
jgi:hypothetical protein